MNCQKCRAPLSLDGSLEDLNPAAYNLILTASSQQPLKKNASPRPAYPEDKQRKALYDKVSQNAGPPVFRRHAGAGTHPNQRDAAMSFIYLTESQVTHPNPSPQKDVTENLTKPQTKQSPVVSRDGDVREPSSPADMERINKLFEIISARSDIDHPICVECTELLLDGLQKRLDAATKERDAYVGFLKQVQADQPTDEEVQAQADAVKKAQKEQVEAMAELLRLEKEKAALDDEMLALVEESRQLDLEEEQFWRERNGFAAKLADFQNERDSINSKFDHDSQLLEKLQRSNVYNDTFCISHDGTFATINGLRLGRLSSKPVDWPEINAAWGHALLLLDTVATKLGYNFVGYEPVPMGSTSKIIRFDGPSPTSSRLGSRGGQAPPPAMKRNILELYSSGDMPLGLTFMHRKFDIAMVAFLELVRQLGAFVQEQTDDQEHRLTLPYRIEGDKIGDISIKLGIAQDDGWTKACKLTLTCCKFLLAHASNVNSRNANA